MTAWALWTQPMHLSSATVVYLVLPLCLAVAIAYKTIRAQQLRRLPLEIVITVAYVGTGLLALAVGLWLIQVIAL
jgi:hypothetical protein